MAVSGERQPWGAGRTIVPAHLPSSSSSHHRGTAFRGTGLARVCACPAWSGCTGRFSGRSSSASCWLCGICPCSCRRRGPPDRAGAASSTLARTGHCYRSLRRFHVGVQQHPSEHTARHPGARFQQHVYGHLDAIFPADALSSTFPLMIGFGVVAVVLIVLTRGRWITDGWPRRNPHLGER